MLLFDIFSESLGKFILGEQIHPKGQIAFLERLFQIENLLLLGRSGEYYHVQVGLRARSPGDAGAVDPYGDMRQVPAQQVEYDPALTGGNIDSVGHSHVRVLMVW